MEIGVSGGVVFSGLGSAMVVVGAEMAVDAVTVMRVGTGIVVVMVLRPGPAGAGSVRLVVLAVVTASGDVATVVDGTPDIVVVA